MRQRYIVSYDICDDKRLRKVAKVMEGFGQRVQYSVFECDLTPTDVVRMRSKLLPVMHAREDQVLFIDIGPSNSPRQVIEALGRPYLTRARDCVVV
jgi:CRISPR-associated protein Cas2